MSFTPHRLRSSVAAEPPASLLAHPPGTTFDFDGLGWCQKVTVSGQSADAGKVFLHGLRAGIVEMLDGTPRERAGAPWPAAEACLVFEVAVAGFARVRNVALQSLAVGALFWYDGKLHCRVAVKDAAGTEIQPQQGTCWARCFATTQVMVLADTTIVEREHGSLDKCCP